MRRSQRTLPHDPRPIPLRHHRHVRTHHGAVPGLGDEMIEYSSNGRPKWDDQFRETQEERNERHRERRAKENREILMVLIADLSVLLTDENDSLSIDGLADLRRRVANALPPDKCPDWLCACRDPSLTQGRTP